jgi:hypothetical protein
MLSELSDENIFALNHVTSRSLIVVNVKVSNLLHFVIPSYLIFTFLCHYKLCNFNGAF